VSGVETGTNTPAVGPGGRTAAVVIPTYNRADMVGDAIEGCLDQTVRPEVIVVDDGSTDDTVARLREGHGDQITLLARANAERGAARNAGAAMARSDILIFLDADDRLRPAHVERVLALAEAHPEATLWATAGVETDRAFRPIGEIARTAPGPIRLEEFLGGEQTVLLPFGVARARFHELGGFVEERELMGSEDWLLTARLLARGPGVRAPDVTIEKRTHDDNTMSASAGMERSMRASRALLFGRWRAELAAVVDDVPALEGRARHAMLRNLAATHYGAGAMAAARRVAREAAGGRLSGVLSDPSLRRSWVRSWLGGPLTRWLRSLR
jgi:hypothetical protein